MHFCGKDFRRAFGTISNPINLRHAKPNFFGKSARNFRFNSMRRIGYFCHIDSAKYAAIKFTQSHFDIKPILHLKTDSQMQR